MNDLKESFYFYWFT